MKFKNIILIGAVLFFSVCMVILSSCNLLETFEFIRKGDWRTIDDIDEGSSSYANDFTLSDLEGNEISLSDFRGEIVVINFWATWCPPCREEIPDFIDVYAEYKGKGVRFIGISNESAKDLKDFAEDLGINYPILIDTKNISGQWGIRAIPTTFILDKSGQIIFKNIGLMTKDQLINSIEEAL